MDLMKCLADWQAKDDARESVPGEHAMVAAAGGALIVAALLGRGGISGTVKALLGGALLVRAASGRDGIACWSRCGDGSSKNRDGGEASATAGQRPAWDFPKSPEQAPGGE
jgi:hypothetical protein